MANNQIQSLIKLLPHQEDAYNSLINFYKRKARQHSEFDNRACIVHATGTGKSFLSLNWIAENRKDKVLYLAPNQQILNEIIKAYKNAGIDIDKALPNLQFATYPFLAGKDHNLIIEDLRRKGLDKIVLDEFHRCGASVWGQAVESLLHHFPKAKVLGTSATSKRYLDNGREMSEELFGGNIVSTYLLENALIDKVLPRFEYVSAVYSYEKIIQNLEEKRNSIDEKLIKKSRLNDLIKKLKRLVANADTLPQMFEKRLSKEGMDNGKYIVFCQNIEHKNQLMKECDEWFSKVNSNVSKYDIDSRTRIEDSIEKINNFSDNNDNTLKLLFSVDMLNEGLHVKGVDGVIMMRPTASPRIFLQQLGRGLSATSGKNSPVIFDMVNNIEVCEEIYDFKDSLQQIFEESFQADNKTKSDNKEPKNTLSNIIKIYDELSSIREVTHEINKLFTRDWDSSLEDFKAFVIKNKRLPKKGEEDEDRNKIASFWANQKHAYNKKELSEERIAKIEYICSSVGLTAIWTSSNEQQWERIFEAFKTFVIKHKRLPKRIEEDKNANKVGEFWNAQKAAYNKGKLKEFRSAMIEEICDTVGLTDIWANSNEQQWERAFEIFKTFVNKHRRLPKEGEEDENRNKVGNFWNAQKTIYSKGELSKERIAKIKDICSNVLITDIWANSNEQQWERSFENFKAFVIKYRRLPKYGKEDEYGNNVDNFWVNQKHAYNKGKLKEFRSAMIEEVCDTVGLTDIWVNSNEQQWKRAFEVFKTFVDKHRRLPKEGEEDENRNKVGNFWNTQKTIYSKEKLKGERIVLFRKIPLCNEEFNGIDERQCSDDGLKSID